MYGLVALKAFAYWVLFIVTPMDTVVAEALEETAHVWVPYAQPPSVQRHQLSPRLLHALESESSDNLEVERMIQMLMNEGIFSSDDVLSSECASDIDDHIDKLESGPHMTSVVRQISTFGEFCAQQHQVEGAASRGEQHHLLEDAVGERKCSRDPVATFGSERKSRMAIQPLPSPSGPPESYGPLVMMIPAEIPSPCPPTLGLEWQ